MCPDPTDIWDSWPHIHHATRFQAGSFLSRSMVPASELRRHDLEPVLGCGALLAHRISGNGADVQLSVNRKAITAQTWSLTCIQTLRSSSGLSPSSGSSLGSLRR